MAPTPEKRGGESMECSRRLERWDAMTTLCAGAAKGVNASIPAGTKLDMEMPPLPAKHDA